MSKPNWKRRTDLKFKIQTLNSSPIGLVSMRLVLDPVWNMAIMHSVYFLKFDPATTRNIYTHFTICINKHVLVRL